MNTLLAATLVVLVAAGLSAGGFVLASRRIPEKWLVADPDGASTVYATVGMVYAIIIAIAAIAVWEPRSAASGGAEQEASALVEAHWAANSLAPSDKAEIQTLIIGYLNEAATNEWRNLRDHQAGTAEAAAALTELRQRIDTIDPITDRQVNAQDQLSAYASEAATARLSRISAASTALPPLLWWILILGGLVSVVFLYMFGLKPTFPNAVMLAVVGGMLALMIFVIYQVEYPYSRGFALEPTALLTALSHLNGSG